MANAYRITALITALSIRALKWKNGGRWSENIDAATDALTADKATEFPTLCRNAILYGLVPNIGTEWAKRMARKSTH
ncbi:MAG: hypothetical protein LVR00_06135 [Rhabdochlamydiaceae bacterium]|jgi:hypothetical protein